MAGVAKGGVIQHPIIIAGGGIGGLAAALACAKAGRQTIILERAAAFEEVGAGLQLGPNAVRALKILGAWDEVAAIATAPPAIVMRDARSGSVIRRVRLTEVFSNRYGAPYRVAHRADLHAALMACVRRQKKIDIHTGQEIVGLEQYADHVRLSTKQGTSHVGEILVAADGMNSGLRQKLWPESAAVLAGQVMHRALIDMPPGMVDVDCVNLWMGPGYHVVHYPVGSPARLNIICVAHVGQSPHDIAAVACAEVRSLLQTAPQWLPWDAKHVPLLSRWHRDRVLLLGDAAHGTVPFFAQGAAMALEDAAMLCAVLRNGLPLPHGLAEVSNRVARVKAVHKASVRQGKIYSASGLIAFGRNVALRVLPEDAFLGQLSWLYDYRP